MADRILMEFGLDKDTAEARDLHNGADRYWTGLAVIADENGDDRISAAEFVTAAQHRLRDDPAGFAEVVRPWAEAVIRIADTDGDGEVGLDEWTRMLIAMGVSPQCAHDRARETDKDGDGTVTLRELLDTAAEFYASETPSSDFAASR